MKKRNALLILGLASLALPACSTINNNKTIDIASGLSLLSSIHDYAANNTLSGLNYSLSIVTSIYRSAESLEASEEPLSSKSVSLVYDKSQSYYLTYDDGVASKGFAIDTNGDYLVKENDVSRAFDSKKDSAILPYIDLPGYFMNLTLAFCDASTNYLTLVNNSESNPLTSYSLTSSGGGSLSVHLTGKKMDYNSCFADADSLVDSNLTLLKGDVSGSYLTSLVGSYPATVNNVARQGECVMSLRYSA
jgi:hypothetical protein